MLKAKIAVLVSGGGTNLQALIDAEKSGIIKSGEIALVVSNNKEAYALKRAENADVKTEIVLKKDFSGQEAFEERIKEILKENEIDFIVLAGFMSILSENFTKDFPERIINVHPSLIPSFCGKGFYGLRVHEAALSYGVKVTGATVHFVIILQKAVEIKNGDTAEVLQRRVMEEAEWKILPEATELVAKKIIKGE